MIAQHSKACSCNKQETSILIANWTSDHKYSTYWFLYFLYRKMLGVVWCRVNQSVTATYSFNYNLLVWGSNDRCKAFLPNIVDHFCWGNKPIRSMENMSCLSSIKYAAHIVFHQWIQILKQSISYHALTRFVEKVMIGISSLKLVCIHKRQMKGCRPDFFTHVLKNVQELKTLISWP